MANAKLDGFKRSVQSHLTRASQALGMPESVIIAQWANESAYGTSSRAKKDNNLGGIKWSKYSQTASKAADGIHARYDSLYDFTTDYIRVMKLSYYDKVRAAGKTGNVAATISALGESPYAGSKYKASSTAAAGSALAQILGITLGGSAAGTTNAGNCPAPKVCPTCKGTGRV